MLKAFEASAKYPNPSVTRHVIEFQPLPRTNSGFFGSTSSKFRVRFFRSGWMLRYTSVILNKMSSMDLKSSKEYAEIGLTGSSGCSGFNSREDVTPEKIVKGQLFTQMSSSVLVFFIQVILYFKVYLMTCPTSPIILLPALVL